MNNSFTNHHFIPAVKRQIHFWCTWTVLLGTLFTLVPCRQTAAEDSIAQSTSLNLEVVGALPSTEPGIALNKVQKLITLLETKVAAKVPDDILIQVKSHAMKLEITKDAKTAEVFLDPDKSPNKDLEIQLRPNYLLSDESDLLVTHAYFHAIHYVIHPSEDPWIREGLAQLFEYIVNKRLNSGNMDAAFSRPFTPLMGEYVPDQIDDAQYGHDLLYFYYLYENCGKDQLFWKIARGRPGIYGSSTVENALKEMRAENKSVAELPQCGSFEESAISFEIARALNAESGGNKNPSRYYVSFGIQNRMKAIKNPSVEDLSKLKNVERFQPMLFSYDTQLSSANLNQGSLFWLHNEYPYEVSEDPPSERSEEWTQLVFKK
jgi:hypothetical protein